MNFVRRVFKMSDAAEKSPEGETLVAPSGPKWYHERALWLLISGLAILPIAYQLSLLGYLDVLAGNVTGYDLATFADKLEFTSKYLTLPAIWLVWNIIYVEVRRVQVGAGLDVSATPEGPQVDNFNIGQRVLANSVEQVLVSVTTQLALTAIVDGYTLVRTIPILNFLWLVGRIFFFLGYPKHRCFGWPLTFYSVAAGSLYALYAFVRFFLFYSRW